MTDRATQTRKAFVQYLEQGLLLTNTPQLQSTSVALYRLLASGVPVTRRQLATTCGMPEGRIDRLLGEFAPSAVEFDADGAIAAFGGLSLAPTRHRFVAGGIELHTWCVLDALFLPEILDKPATLVTRCPASGLELTVELTARELHAIRPQAAVMSIVAPDRDACCDNLRGAFCDRVSLFRDRDAFEAWSRDRKDVACVSVSDAHRFARHRNASRYRDVKLRT